MFTISLLNYSQGFICCQYFLTFSFFFFAIGFVIAPVFVFGAGFVVHRGRTIPTLASMQEPLVPARLRQAKEKSNHDSKNDERGGRFRCIQTFYFSFLISYFSACF